MHNLTADEIQRLNESIPALSKQSQIEEGKFPARGLGDLLQDLIATPVGQIDHHHKLDATWTHENEIIVLRTVTADSKFKIFDFVCHNRYGMSGTTVSMRRRRNGVIDGALYPAFSLASSDSLQHFPSSASMKFGDSFFDTVGDELILYFSAGGHPGYLASIQCYFSVKIGKIE